MDFQSSPPYFVESAMMYSPYRNRRRLDNVNTGEWEHGTTLERILKTRPSMAAAMLSSRNTLHHDFRALHTSLSLREVEPKENVHHRPPPTPLFGKRQCYSTKLRRRNAMTATDIRRVKLRNRGPQQYAPSTKPVECIVIRNPSSNTESSQCLTPQMRKRARAEFAYFSNPVTEKQKRIFPTPARQHLEEKSKRGNSDSPGFFRNLLNKMRGGRDAPAEICNNGVKAEDFLHLWQSPQNEINQVVPSPRMDGRKMYSPVAPGILKQNVTDSRMRNRLGSQDSLSMGYCLKNVLRSKKFCRNFRDFLVGEFSEENINFWMECEAYRKKKGDKLSKHAIKIYQTYLKPGSLKEVNVSAEARARVECEIFSPGRTTFEQAQEQVYRLMLTDSFPRFLEISRNARPRLI